jgi:uncharacterized FAD-dependent dehydrogenase
MPFGYFWAIAKVTNKKNINNQLVRRNKAEKSGAGYAGGITSSAIDGINCAKAIIELM